MADTVNLKDWMAKVNAVYGGGVVKFGSSAIKVARFSTGSIDLDLCLGGGWPFGRIVIVAGEESTGKTTIALKAANSVVDWDHKTKKHRELVKPEDFEACRCLYLDIEGTWDMEWAKALGFNPDYHVVSQPTYAEQAIDLVTSAINSNLFDLIILDSIAALTPTSEVSESVESWQMGLGARLVNKAMRKWVSELNKLFMNGGTGPLVLCLNQFRLKIGKEAMFGDPRVLPNGKAQRFAASIIVYTKSGGYGDTKEAELAEVELGGSTPKNKLYVPKQNYSFVFGLKDTEELKKGSIDNAKHLVDLGIKYKLIVKDKGVRFNKVEYSTQKELVNLLKVDKNLNRLLWKSIIHVATGQYV